MEYVAAAHQCRQKKAHNINNAKKDAFSCISDVFGIDVV
jgi:hypothetical protein